MGVEWSPQSCSMILDYMRNVPYTRRFRDLCLGLVSSYYV